MQLIFASFGTRGRRRGRETATGIAGARLFCLCTMILSAKSGTHVYQCCCFSDPRRTIRCPSQTSLSIIPWLEWRKEKLGTKRKKQNNFLTNILSAQESKKNPNCPILCSLLTTSSCSALLVFSIWGQQKGAVTSPMGRSNMGKLFQVSLSLSVRLTKRF